MTLVLNPSRYLTYKERLTFSSHRIVRRVEDDDACKALSTVLDIHAEASVMTIMITIAATLELLVLRSELSHPAEGGGIAQD